MTATFAAVAPGRTLDRGPGRAWPAYAIAGGLGLFCLAVGGAFVFDQVVRDNPLTSGAVIALVASGLRLGTVVVALAAVRPWGRLVPDPLLSLALWGIAIAQLAYPLAETVVKLAILLGVMEPLDKGISNMSGEGWFNFGAAWLLWGVPGVLFALLAADHRRRTAQPWWLAPAGAVSGALALAALGLIIG